MNKPHVHAELIKAWADGAEIEYWCPTTEGWKQAEVLMWNSFIKYRIKPTKITLEQAREAFTWFWGDTLLSESLQTIRDYLFQEE